MPRAPQSFRYGFKSMANALAAEVRVELGLGALDPLLPAALADHLAIPLTPLTALRAAAPLAVKHFCQVERGVFSAVTVFDGARRLIVYNDRHPRTRQANTIVHELSHALLQHPPHAALDTVTGCRIWRDEIENEANFLAGVLLLTEAAALSIVRTGVNIAAAAAHYGVSDDLVRYRINVTGARKRVQKTV